MPTDHRAELKKIRTFPSLIRYLREEMGWPINTGDFEELTFEYTPEELGIDTASAAKIQEIKRLRPLSPNQPWGIFFIKFEPKKLPVVALRRILSRVVLKKRASANSAERAAWAADDLLFVSNFGEGDERQISLAHFSQHGHKNDLPTLKVLGWDNLDTPLHLDHVAELLIERLAWPEDDKDLASWRDTWRSAFTLRHREVITTSKALAVRLAGLARNIRDRIRTVLAIETENGPVTRLMKAFKEALIHDLDADTFADMYAQTIAYGLLSARVTNPNANTADGFAAQLPVTNPFLKDLMETFLHVGGRKGKAGRDSGIDFDELGVSEVVELLDDANMEAVVRDFGDRNPQEDPVIHFYELFLKEYDARKRMQRGVFYTPRPVVSYIVRSVDELLRTEFGLEDGLADTTSWGEMAKRHEGLKIPEGVAPGKAFVQILDPAAGTGTFLVEVIDLIYRRISEKWKAQGHGKKKIDALWNDYVPKHLLTRLYGYELLMAPYAIAHLKIGLKLYETGYCFDSNERARIYLTNALEPAHDFSGRFEFAVPALAHEAQAVNEIKRNQCFTVVIGNPPYAQYSMNLNEAARAHIERFRYANGQRIKARNALQLERNLNDDYVKFLGFSSALLPPGAGILGMITNRMYLESESLVGLREWFATHFNKIYVMDLWGSSEESRRVERLAVDENVFDILQGVAVSFFIQRQPSNTVPSAVFARELIGKREEKYRLLVEELRLDEGGWDETRPSPEMWRLNRTAAEVEETEKEFTLAEIFPQFSTLVASNRDHLVVNFDREVVIRNVDAVRSFRGSNEELSQRFGITLKTGWNVKAAREKLREIRNLSAHMEVIEYRPFDRRWIFFHPTLVWQTAPVSSNNVLGGRSNRVMISLGKNRAETINGQWVSRTLADKSVVSTRDNASGFPLYLNDFEGGLRFSEEAARANLSPEFIRHLAIRLGVSQTGPQGFPLNVTPEDIFHYAYAVFYSPGYRTRYAEFLKIDFPRLPLTSSMELFRKLARLGGELVALHLVETPTQQALSARYDKDAKAWRYEVAKGRSLPLTLTFNSPEKPVVSKVGWSDNTVWIDAVKPKKDGVDAKTTGTIGFRGVSEDVWNFHIGGYQVCEKWLKDRKDCILTIEDIVHYHRIVIALHETIRLMREIDEVIEQSGGWPGAFAQRASAVASQEPVVGEKIVSEVMVPSCVKASGSKVYKPDSLPLMKVAESNTQEYGLSNKESKEDQKD